MQRKLLTKKGKALELNAKWANRQISYLKYTRNGVVEQGMKRGQQGMSRE